MPLVDLTKPGEKKKLIWAGALGLVALVVLYWTFIGFDSGPKTAARPAATPTPQRAVQQTPQRPGNATVSPEVKDLQAFTEVSYDPISYTPPEAKRNIFAFYVPPPPVVNTPTPPPPSPTPTPPVLLASVSPANVYARTAEFKL